MKRPEIERKKPPNDGKMNERIEGKNKMKTDDVLCACFLLVQCSTPAWPLGCRAQVMWAEAMLLISTNWPCATACSSKQQTNCIKNNNPRLEYKIMIHNNCVYFIKQCCGEDFVFFLVFSLLNFSSPWRGHPPFDIARNLLSYPERRSFMTCS